MKRNFILPSETLNYVQHDCRPENLKYRLRSNLYDVSVLSTILKKTKSSINIFYVNYLTHPEEVNFTKSVDTLSSEITKSTEKIKDNNTIITKTDSSSNDNEIQSANKVLKEIKINNNDSQFGNVLWPSAIVSTYGEEIICTDTTEHRLLVFNKELLYKYQIGTKGNREGEFNEPVDIVINEMGRLYIADKNNYRIQIFIESKKFKEVKLGGGSSITSSFKMDSLKQKSFKTGTEFVFSKLINFNDKPVKLTSAPLSPIVGVSTENGYIYILNETNQIINFLKLKNRFSIYDLRNICLNENGSELILMKQSDHQMYLKFYKIDVEDDDDYDQVGKIDPFYIKKLEMSRKIKLDKNYYPGICLIKSNCIRLSLDLKHLLIFDSLNLNLLEYDLNGKFKRVLLKAENHLTNLLAFDFTGDRQHLITCEAEQNKKASFLDSKYDFKADEFRDESERTLSRQDSSLRFRSRNYSFKIKIFRYRECECHRQALSKSRLTMFNRSIGFNQSYNNFSMDSESGDFNI